MSPENIMGPDKAFGVTGRSFVYVMNVCNDQFVLFWLEMKTFLNFLCWEMEVFCYICPHRGGSIYYLLSPADE